MENRCSSLSKYQHTEPQGICTKVTWMDSFQHKKFSLKMFIIICMINNSICLLELIHAMCGCIWRQVYSSLPLVPNDEIQSHVNPISIDATHDWAPQGTHAIMRTSSNGYIFHVTGPLCGEFTGHRWIPLTNASDAELLSLLWSVPD